MNTLDLEQLSSFAPIIIMVVIFYFLLWRPQKKQQKRRQEMLDSLKPGVKIVTAGGVYGTIVTVRDEYLIIRIADKVEIKVTRQAISQVLGKGEKVQAKEARQAEKKVEQAIDAPQDTTETKTDAK